MSQVSISGYKWRDGGHAHAHSFILPVLDNILKNLPKSSDNRLFDLGCGNGSIANHLYQKGYAVSGVDPSEQGIQQAKENYPQLNLNAGSAYDNLAEQYGTFPLIISLEVVEHVYAPRDYAKALFNLTATGGVAIVSTPYHSYLKNLALALSGKMDKHFTALWDHGHIKFWSKNTLTQLLTEAGFENVSFHLAGRIPPLAKSMLAVAHRPA